MGIEARALTPAEQRSAQVDHGLLIEQIGGQASSAGLKPGDIVLAVNQVPVSTTAQFVEQLRQAGSNAALLVQRSGARLYVPIRGE